MRYDNRALRFRVQRARKRGMTLREIAAKEGKPLSTVAKMVDGPEFKRNLLFQQKVVALKKAETEHELVAHVTALTTMLQAALGEQDVRKSALLARTLRELAQASIALGNSAREGLKAQLTEAEQDQDPALERARLIREAKAHARAAKVEEAKAIEKAIEAEVLKPPTEEAPPA